jgi:hypothetical protein
MLLKIAVMIPILLAASLAGAHAFELFGIDIGAASRPQITAAILQHGAQKLPSSEPLIDRYEADRPFAGARMFVGFTENDKLENMVFQFDSGSWFIDVLTFDELKRYLVETYGEPITTPVETRDNDLEEELSWTRDGVNIRLISYKWFAAWRVHVTHQLYVYSGADGVQ